MMNCEIHLTISTAHSARAEILAQELKWKTSEIARDPVLGQNTYFYLTTHTPDISSAFNRIEQMRNWLAKWKIPLLREKIEIIVHDKRWSA